MPDLARSAAALRGVGRRRVVRPALVATLLLLPVTLVACYGEVWASGAGGPAEMALFGPAGADLLTGHWSSVYASSGIQGGPFELVPYGAAELLGVSGTFGWTAYYVACTSVLIGAFLVGVLACLPRLAGRRRLLGLVALGAAACLSGLLPWAFDVGHPAQAIIPMLWFAAATAARNRRFALVGLLLGLSTGWETWGILGAPVIFCAVKRPRFFPAISAGSITLAALYGPFIASGHFAMFSFAWPINAGTLVHQLAPGLHTFDWPLRLLQAVAAVGVGALVALASRKSAHSGWLTLLAVLGVRLLLDPCLYSYYWIAPGILLLAAAALSTRRRNFVLGVLTGVGALWLAMTGGHGPRDAMVLAALAVLVALASRWSVGSRSAEPVPGRVATRWHLSAG